MLLIIPLYREKAQLHSIDYLWLDCCRISLSLTRARIDSVVDPKTFD